MLKQFDSVESFARECSALPTRYHCSTYGEDDWAGGTMEHCVRMATDGETSLVQKAQEYLDRLEVQAQTKTLEWSHSPVGCRVAVPDYLTGSPTPMRRKRRVQTDTAPINIYVSLTCSSSIDHETLLNRGIVILALLMKLQEVRPVQLYLVSETDGSDGLTLLTMRVESQPLNLSTAIYALARPGFSRQMSHSMSRYLNHFGGRWPNGYRSEKYRARRAELLGLTGEDIFIGAAESWDPIVKDSVNWLQSQLDRYMKQSEEYAND